jgi:hypothetical protein
MVSLPVQGNWVKSPWLVVFLFLVLVGPFVVYEQLPIQTLDAETSLEATSSLSHTSSLTESIDSYNPPDLVRSPAPAIPVFEGVGGNITATPYIERTDSAYVTTGRWGDSPYQVEDTTNDTIFGTPPAGGTIGHIACSIDNVYGYEELSGLVPDLSVWPFKDIFPYGGEWETAVAGTNDPLTLFSWNPPAGNVPGTIGMHIETNPLIPIPRTSVGELRTWVDTAVHPWKEYLQVFLHFKVNIAISVLPFTHTDDTRLRVYYNDHLVWSKYFGYRDDSDGSSWNYGYSVYVDVTDHVVWDDAYQQVELYLISDTEYGLATTSNVFALWSDVKVFTTEDDPIEPTEVYLEDLDTNQRYYFDSTGYVDFYTTATSWEFGPHPHHYFDANWTISATLSELQNMTTQFSSTVDAPFVSWEVTSPSSIISAIPGWIYSRYESVFPLDWTYNQSEVGVGARWNGAFHILSSYTSGWHHFLAPNTAIDTIVVAMQNHTRIIRSPCNHFMQGEQYAINAVGIPGSYYLDVYNPLTYHESGNGWVTQDDMWTRNNTDHLLTIPLNAPLGSYTVVIKCLGLDPLIRVGYTSTTFEVNEYHISTLDSEINPDGTVTVSGQLGSEDNGDYNVYFARTLIQTPAIDAIYNRPFGDMLLHHWYQTDCLISATGETIGIHFSVNNTGLEKENVTVMVRFMSLAGRSYVLFEKSSLVATWETNQIQEFDWPNLWIGTVGNNTMLRHGFYFMELEINGYRAGLHSEAYGSYLAVTDSPSLHGRVPAIHTAAVEYPDFSKEFRREFPSEMSIPGTNYFLVTVLDSHHITSDNVLVCNEHLKLITRLERPIFNNRTYHGCTVVHRNGSILAIARIWGAAPRFSSYNHSDQEFVLDYYVKWDAEFEYWGSTPIIPHGFGNDLNGVGFLQVDSAEYPPGSYQLEIRYRGDEFTHYCQMNNTLEFAPSTITTPVPGPGTSAGFGQRGSLSAQLQAWTYESHYGWVNPRYGPIAGQELIFAIHNGITWQIMGVGITDSQGWAQIFYTTNLVPGTYRVRVIFEGSGFLADSMAEYNITIGMSVLFIGIITPIIVIPIVVSVFVIRKIRKGRMEGGE